MKICCVYKITNRVSGKAYIGQTTDLNQRIRSHRCYGRKGIGKAIKKYGWDCFDLDILETCEPSALNELEIKYIETYNTIAPNGYNLALGGNGSGNHTDATKKLISKANKGLGAKTWRLTFKDGSVITLTNLAEWCKLNQFNYSHIIAIRRGSRKSHNGIIKVECP